MAATETAKQLENEAVAQRKADEKKERKQLNIRRMKRLLRRPKNRLEKLVRQQRNKQVRCVSLLMSSRILVHTTIDAQMLLSIVHDCSLTMKLLHILNYTTVPHPP